MTTRLLLILASFLLFTAPPAFAHRPYERSQGTFHRSDGQELSVVEHYVDGIIAADPVAIQFCFRDGTVVAATDYTTDAVIRRTPSAIQVFEFPSTWLPIASRVHQFDGYSLTDVTTPTKRFFSPLFHTRDHWVSYAVALGFAALFPAGWFGTRAIPKHGCLAFLRLLGFVAVGLATALYVLFVLWIAPVSPFILCFLGAFCFALSQPMRRCVARVRAANQRNVVNSK